MVLVWGGLRGVVGGSGAPIKAGGWRTGDAETQTHMLRSNEITPKLKVYILPELGNMFGG